MLSIDYMIVQGNVMLVSISSVYLFHTINPVYKRKANKKDIFVGVRKIIQLYTSRGLQVSQINIDNEFQCIRDEFRLVFLNIIAVNEHVGEVECTVRSTKDDTCSHIHRLPYTHYPRAMVVEAVTYSIKLRNYLPADNFISPILSPASLITDRPLLPANSIKIYSDFQNAINPAKKNYEIAVKTIFADDSDIKAEVRSLYNKVSKVASLSHVKSHQRGKYKFSNLSTSAKINTFMYDIAKSFHNQRIPLTHHDIPIFLKNMDHFPNTDPAASFQIPAHSQMIPHLPKAWVTARNPFERITQDVQSTIFKYKMTHFNYGHTKCNDWNGDHLTQLYHL